MPSSYRYFEDRRDEVLGRLRELLEEEDPILLAIILVVLLIWTTTVMLT